MSDLTFEKKLPDVVQEAENLPSLPTVAVEVLRLSADESSTLDDLARVLSQDPALAVKLLKLSNSALFNPNGSEITNLSRATMVLGMKTVKLMSLSFSLAERLPREGTTGGFDLMQYWRRSLVSAVAGRSLANLVGSAYGDEAFLCGLLGHLGRLVLARCLPAEYEPVCRAGNGWPSIEAEERILGFNSADTAATLLREWGLPSVVYITVGYLHRADALPPETDGATRALVDLMALAACTERVLCEEEKGVALQELHKLAAARFELSESQIDAYLVSLEAALGEAAEMLNIDVVQELSHQEVLEQARNQIVQVGLGTAVDLTRATRRTEELEKQQQELETRATTDALTRLPNRAAFDGFLEREVRSRMDGGIPYALGLAILDVDHFKQLNDTYGHDAGDEVLRSIGHLLASETRQGDLIARYGGEEFAIVVPQTTPRGLHKAAERLRRRIEATPVEYEGQRLRITASLGAACVKTLESVEGAKALIKLADRYLYAAKESGRNRTETHPGTDFPR